MRQLQPVTEHDLPVNLRPAYRAIRQAGRRVESRSLGRLVASLAAMSPEELDDLASQIAMLYVEVARRVEGEPEDEPGVRPPQQRECAADFLEERDGCTGGSANSRRSVGPAGHVTC
jgi:hypothetical protein